MSEKEKNIIIIKNEINTNKSDKNDNMNSDNITENDELNKKNHTCLKNIMKNDKSDEDFQHLKSDVNNDKSNKNIDILKNTLIVTNENDIKKLTEIKIRETKHKASV